jgi:hypothetical protein
MKDATAQYNIKINIPDKIFLKGIGNLMSIKAALPARHEWVKNNERMTNKQYQKYFLLSL